MSSSPSTSPTSTSDSSGQRTPDGPPTSRTEDSDGLAIIKFTLKLVLSALLIVLGLVLAITVHATWVFIPLALLMLVMMALAMFWIGQLLRDDDSPDDPRPRPQQQGPSPRRAQRRLASLDAIFVGRRTVADHPASPRTRRLLLLVRYGLALIACAAGFVYFLVTGGKGVGPEVLASMAGAGGGAFLVSIYLRMTFDAADDREVDEARRMFYDRYGLWPDQLPADWRPPDGYPDAAAAFDALIEQRRPGSTQQGHATGKHLEQPSSPIQAGAQPVSQELA